MLLNYLHCWYLLSCKTFRFLPTSHQRQVFCDAYSSQHCHSETLQRVTAVGGPSKPIYKLILKHIIANVLNPESIGYNLVQNGWRNATAQTLRSWCLFLRSMVKFWPSKVSNKWILALLVTSQRFTCIDNF